MKYTHFEEGEQKLVYFEINFLDTYVNTLTCIVDIRKPFIAKDILFLTSKFDTFSS